MPDLISQPNGLDPDASISLHLTFPSRQAMNNCFSHYHARIGETITVPGQYTIIGVEPDLAPTKSQKELMTMTSLLIKLGFDGDFFTFFHIIQEITVTTAVFWSLRTR